MSSANFVIPAPLPVSLPVAGTSQRFPVRRVFCVGRNYEEHAKEMGFTGREPPFFFMKPADTLVSVEAGSEGQINYPTMTQNLHHEIELVVALGSGGRDIPAAQAQQHIYGYAVGLDMTRRDLQTEMKKQGRPWEIGKAFEESAPIGPIVPAQQVNALNDAAIWLKVNGQVRQTSHIHQLIWNIGEIIEHLSSAWELAPGDLIFTGTPAGVAAVVAGDVMEGGVDGLPNLQFKVI
jgi:fumarylpyruvate hydrolase